MMRRFVDRLRSEYTRVVRAELVEAKDSLQTSWSDALEELRRDVVAERNDMELLVRADRAELALAVQRLAGALDNIAATLDADRRERAVHIDLVECLLRELIVFGALPQGLASPSFVQVDGSPAKVIGGSIDAQRKPEVSGAILDGHAAAEASIDPPIDLSALEDVDSDAELTVGTAVEVRSHFHDRWSSGFRIAEVVHDAGRRRFKLTRRSDGSPLPLLFDPSDVRRNAMSSESEFAVDFMQQQRHG